MPDAFAQLGRRAAEAAGFEHFEPSAAILNRYAVGSKMSLHQDRDEQDLSQPIVSLSLGLPAGFRLGGFERSAPTQRRLLEHGDLVVWGGPSRLRFHGVQPIQPARHPKTGPFRYNVTFRSVKP
jgi:alkylated DNA repair protein (DNA oxidative demethylase)